MHGVSVPQSMTTITKVFGQMIYNQQIDSGAIKNGTINIFFCLTHSHIGKYSSGSLPCVTFSMAYCHQKQSKSKCPWKFSIVYICNSIFIIESCKVVNKKCVIHCTTTILKALYYTITISTKINTEHFGTDFHRQKT